MIKRRSRRRKKRHRKKPNPNNTSEPKEKKSLKQAVVTIPDELLGKVSLSHLSAEQISNMLLKLDEYTKDEINRRINIICENISSQPEISVSYFVPDEKKAGGAYVEHTGNVRRIDDIQGIMIFDDGKEIILGDIISVNGKVIDEQMKGY